MGMMPWDSVAGLLETGLEKIFPNKADADAAKAKLIEAQQKGELKQLEYDFELAKAQIEVNKTEAASDHWFVASWRPFIGWVCGSAFAWVFVLQPFAVFFLAVFGVEMDVPDLDLSEMMPVLLGMIGIGGMRSYDKKNGTSRGRD